MLVPVGYMPFLNLFVVIGDLSPCIKLVNIIPSTGKTNMTSPTDLVRFQVSTTKTSLLVVHKQILTLLLIMVDVVMVCEPPTLWLYQDCNCNRLFVGQNYYQSCKTAWFQPVPTILKRIRIVLIPVIQRSTGPTDKCPSKNACFARNILPIYTPYELSSLVTVV